MRMEATRVVPTVAEAAMKMVEREEAMAVAEGVAEAATAVEARYRR